MKSDVSNMTRYPSLGLTSLEVKFDKWQWKEELSVLTLEDVGLGITFVESSQFITVLLHPFSYNNKCCWTWIINNRFYD